MGKINERVIAEEREFWIYILDRKLDLDRTNPAKAYFLLIILWRSSHMLKPKVKAVSFYSSGASSEIVLYRKSQTSVLPVLASWKRSTKNLPSFSSIFAIYIVYGPILSFKGKIIHECLQLSYKTWHQIFQFQICSFSIKRHKPLKYSSL